MSDNRFWLALWTVIVIAIVALVVVGFRSCNEQRDRRAECVKSDKSASDCRMLFPDQAGQ